MKIRYGFVSNSSVTCFFICAICNSGGVSNGWEPDYWNKLVCEKFHFFCPSHLSKELRNEYQELPNDIKEDKIPIRFCPICNLKDISDKNLAQFLLLKKKISQNAIIEELLKSPEILSSYFLKNASIRAKILSKEEDIDKIETFIEKDQNPESKSSKLNGLSFCITGKLTTLTREQAKTKVLENGGIYKSGVIQNLSYLVTNDQFSYTSKIKKAKFYKIPIINEFQFLKLFESDSKKRN